MKLVKTLIACALIVLFLLTELFVLLARNLLHLALLWLDRWIDILFIWSGGDLSGAPTMRASQEELTALPVGLKWLPVPKQERKKYDDGQY
jgi:hypothetical protein